MKFSINIRKKNTPYSERKTTIKGKTMTAETPDVHVVTDLAEKKNFKMTKIVAATLAVLGLATIAVGIINTKKNASGDNGTNTDPTLETIAS